MRSTYFHNDVIAMAVPLEVGHFTLSSERHGVTRLQNDAADELQKLLIGYKVGPMTLD